MKDETVSVVIEEFVKLKPKKFSFLVDENSKLKKEKGIKKILLRQQTVINIKMLF